MKIRCFSRENENQGVHVEFSVRHHPLRIPIPMLEKKIRIQQENLYKNSLTAIVGHDRQYFNELCSTVVSRRIFIRSQSLIAC